jgi:membrane-bound lytic murein transglycosylase D
MSHVTDGCLRKGAALACIVMLVMLQACSTLQSNEGTDVEAQEPAIHTPAAEPATAARTDPTQPESPESKSKVPASEGIEDAAGASAGTDLWARFTAVADDLQCDRLDARSARWLAYYVREAATFKSELRRALPLIVLVTTELERRGLPLQFAMLPMVESQYGAPRSSGNRPAGLWQLMPRTARGLGVAIQSDYDGRLDFLRATEAAVDLLEHLSTEFHGDWRLMNMAYNAGEFRVKRSLRGSRAAATPAEPQGLSKITLHHLAKVQALTCLLAQAHMHGIELPDARAEEILLPVSISKPIATGFLAHLAGLDISGLRRWNPALRGEFTPMQAGLRVLLPLRAAESLAAALRLMPADTWQHWGLIAISSEAERQRVLSRYADRLEAIRAANGSKADTAPTRLWLPIGASRKQRLAEAAQVSDAADVYIIRNGDTLWDIAHHYGLALQSLMDWNRLNAKSILRPGQTIRLRPP